MNKKDFFDAVAALTRFIEAVDKSRETNKISDHPNEDEHNHISQEESPW